MLLAMEVVRDVPIVRARLARNVVAMAHVPAVFVAVVAGDIRADDAAHDRTAAPDPPPRRPADRGRIVAATAADLVAEDAAQDRADDGAGHVGLTVVLD